MNRKYLHVAMYRAMDFVFDKLEQPPEELILFLTDANPYVWEDRTTADPALQSDFNNFMARQDIGVEIDDTEAYRAVKNFLGEQYPLFASFVSKAADQRRSPSFAELFEGISLDEWKNICARVNEEEQ